MSIDQRLLISAADELREQAASDVDVGAGLLRLKAHARRRRRHTVTVTIAALVAAAVVCSLLVVTSTLPGMHANSGTLSQPDPTQSGGPAPTPDPPAPTGSAHLSDVDRAFLRDLRVLIYWWRNVSDDMTVTGRTTCSLLQQGESWQSVRLPSLRPDLPDDPEAALLLTAAAVINFCPAYARGMLAGLRHADGWPWETVSIAKSYLRTAVSSR
jgi:hypothetical protein